MTEQRSLVFDCPHCNEIFAVTKEAEVDIHSGATYRCASCNGRVVFTALTVEQYVDFANRGTDRRSHESNPCDFRRSTTNNIPRKEEGGET